MLSPATLLLWVVFLAIQNVSFTYVSRARNSGSLWRHVKAAIFSNGIWFVSQSILLGPMLEYLQGKHGHVWQAIIGLIYTASTVGGGILAHYMALKTEKGKSAVGANKKYAQIPVEEWHRAQAFMEELSHQPLGYLKDIPQLKTDVARAATLAEQAYDIQVGAIPDSGVTAKKFDGATITTGLPNS